jgi:hypothetical protein
MGEPPENTAETSANVTSLGSSDGEPSKSADRPDDPAGGAGSDVGGPAGAVESTTGDALTGTSTPGAKESSDPDDQATSGV